jgi:hypothetical protein
MGVFGDWQQCTRDAFDAYGVPWRLKKSEVRVAVVRRLGYWMDGFVGKLGPRNESCGLLLNLTSALLKLKLTTLLWTQMLAGQWVFVVQVSRPCFSTFHRLWKGFAAWDSKMRSIPTKVQDEWVLAG